MEIRKATADDAIRIVKLYHDIYLGTYPDALMSDVTQLTCALASADYCWMVAQVGQELVGSVVYRVDELNRLAKVFGAAILPAYRGAHLTERLMNAGRELLQSTSLPVEVIYATTRTVAPAPQKLTANLGYRKLGVLPNVHKTDEYETHCLTALFTPESLGRRYIDFGLHPKVAHLFEIVRGECRLPALPVIPPKAPRLKDGATRPELQLETIEAPRFVGHRFHDMRPQAQEHHWFFPFHEPNLLLTNPDQTVEIFAYYNYTDRHCALIGIRDVNHTGYVNILDHVCRALREMGVRYLEFIMRADATDKIETALQSHFIPCAYFPAMQLDGEFRFDYVVFSRSFEILDFQNLKLEGVNRQYLRQYYENWKEISLDPVLLQ